MTPAERNLFERELQKHPFETEALDGFQNINSNQFQKDLKELKVRIQQEKRKNYYKYWAAAASFLLIVATGIILFQLNEKTTIPKLVENKTVHKQGEQLVKPDCSQILHQQLLPLLSVFRVCLLLFDKKYLCVILAKLFAQVPLISCNHVRPLEEKSPSLSSEFYYFDLTTVFERH